MATTFSLLSPSDADRLNRLLVSWHRADGLSFDGTTAAAAVRRLLKDSHVGHVWLIEVGPEAIGYVVLSFGDAQAGPDPRAYISALYLAPAWRRQGYGDRAQAFVCDVARWLKVRVLAFETASERKHAQLLYRPSSRPMPYQPLQHEAVA